VSSTEVMCSFRRVDECDDMEDKVHVQFSTSNVCSFAKPSSIALTFAARRTCKKFESSGNVCLLAANLKRNMVQNFPL